jgi:hypothetical protein
VRIARLGVNDTSALQGYAAPWLAPAVSRKVS